MGLRTTEIALPLEGALRLTVRWRGRGIHRAGMFVRFVGLTGSVLGSGDVAGDFSGDFEETVARDFIVPENAVWPLGRLIVYIFHDGVGTLEVLSAEVDGAPMGTVWPPGVFDSDRASVMKSSAEPGPPRPEFPMWNGQGLRLLAGESRIFRLPSGQMAPEGARPLAGRSRVVARFHELASCESVTAWLVPPEAKQPHDTDGFVALDGPWPRKADLSTTAPRATPPLPPLPAGRSAYLFHYGNLRFGRTPADAARDAAEMAFIRRAGFTGLAAQDDYGLDYRRTAGTTTTVTVTVTTTATTTGTTFSRPEPRPLSGDFLTSYSRLYRDAGFRDPLVFHLFGGLDRGAETWPGPGADGGAMTRHLAGVGPSLKRAQAVLGGPDRLTVWPVDEPNEGRRGELAPALLAAWRRSGYRGRMLVTGTGPALSKLTTAGPLVRWTGFGETVSFGDARRAGGAGIDGWYASLDAAGQPLRHRYLAGVYAWASGVKGQAWWHYGAVSGSAEHDLDGDQEDIMAVDPAWDARTATPATLSVPFAEVLEGLQDLRLLLAVEAAAPGTPAAADARRVLDSVRKSVPTTDRLPPAWRDPADFETLRGKLVDLWIRTSAAKPARK